MPGGRSADEAVQMIVELEALRARVQGDLRPLASLSVPLMVWGALTLLSAAPAWIDGDWLALYWLLAVPVGLVVVARHFRRLERGIGVWSPGGRTAFALAVALAVAALCAGFLWRGVAVGYVLAAGYAGFAWLLRSRACAALAAGLAIATAAVQASDVDRPDALLAALLGGASLGIGVVLQR